MDHAREHRSLLAAVEKRLLIAIARRLPPAVTSDHLTALALVSMLAAGPAFAAIDTMPAAALIFVGLLVLNWFGDSLDGTLARVRRQQRPRYGYYVDHAIDLGGTVALMAGMASSGLMEPVIAVAVLAAYLLVAAESFLATHATRVFRLSFGGVGPTELRILLAIGALKAAVHPIVHVAGFDVRLFDLGGVIAAASLCVVFVVAAVRNGAALYRAEPLPARHVDALTGAAPCLPS